MKISKLLSIIYNDDYPSPKKRRELLIDNMNSLIAKEKSCTKCPGYCCTKKFNSMQISNIEAIDIYYYLESSKLLEQTVDSIKESIINFRLDKEVFMGKNEKMRRSYTCPFYNHKSLGCLIPAEYKPYGCLAFNPLSINVTTENMCSSDTVIQEKRHQDYELIEKKLNIIINTHHFLEDAKDSIPNKLIKLL